MRNFPFASQTKAIRNGTLFVFLFCTASGPLPCEPKAAEPQPLPEHLTSLNQILSHLHQPHGEISGDSWGWSLVSYPNPVGAYSVQKRLLLLVAHDQYKQLVFDIQTGDMMKLDQTQAESLTGLATKFRYPIYFGSLRDNDGVSIVSDGSAGGGTFSCSLNFPVFLQAFNARSSIHASFYLAVRNRRPEHLSNRACDPDLHLKQKMFSANLTQVNNAEFLPAHDGTIWLLGALPGFALHLDKNFKTHSTLGGSVITIDALRVNPTLKKFPFQQSLAYRQKTMETAAAQASEPGASMSP